MAAKAASALVALPSSTGVGGPGPVGAVMKTCWTKTSPPVFTKIIALQRGLLVGFVKEHEGGPVPIQYLQDTTKLSMWQHLGKKNLRHAVDPCHHGLLEP